MELRDRVVVKSDVNVNGSKLRGMHGIIVDRAQPGEAPGPHVRFVRFPENHLRDEFFAWVKVEDLQIDTHQLN